MKTIVKELSYEEVLKLPAEKTEKPVKPSLFWRTLIKLISLPDLKKAHFKYKCTGMKQLKPNEPCLILMNHSCFLDLEIAESIMYPRPLNIVCTSDGFVGKEKLMRSIGCIPTNKFVTDVVMVRNIKYALDILKSSVLMYPEASYSFDGTATPIPDSLAKLLKLLNVPVVMIKTNGAFLRNPLYNDLQVRNVPVSAEVKYLLSPEQIEQMSLDELYLCLKDEFTFDNFKWQQENHVLVKEPFRADHLNRVLYKCPACKAEGQMNGKGIYVTCSCCGKKYELTEDGFMRALEGETEFNHIPDWYKWERDEVKKEILAGTYKIEADVDICMMVDTKAIYKVGEGHLTHTTEGFTLTGCNGKLNYTQKSKASYSLYSDYYWYEIVDMICIGNMKTLYYCFPKNNADLAAKARIAAEEIYKIKVKRF